jgi:hypothetical protein
MLVVGSRRLLEEKSVNDILRTDPGTSRHPGRLYLVLGILVALAGPVLIAVQMRAHILRTPWYAPILATLGLVLLVAALMQARSLWRWAAAVLVGLFAGFQWVAVLVLMNAPPYTGPAEPGRPFPTFATTFADGSPFTQESLKGDRNTVLVFFRGRW